jgi:hypothetical protein
MIFLLAANLPNADYGNHHPATRRLSIGDQRISAAGGDRVN